MKPVLPFRGADPALLDPYWDYEHEPGDPYRYRVARPYRSRLFATGRPRAQVVLRPRGHEAPLSGLIGRIVPSPEGEAEGDGEGKGKGEIWAPLGRPTIHLDGINHLLGVDVTTLNPGAYELVVQYPSAPSLDRTTRFTIRREPFFTPWDDKLSRVRSSTGLVERAFDGKRYLLTAHGWDVEEHRWLGGGSYDARKRRVVAVTWFDLETIVPLKTRIALRPPDTDDLADWSPHAFSTDPQWAPPEHHADRPTHDSTSPKLALPFPELIGLPQQPPPTGDYALSPPTADPSQNPAATP